MFKMCIWLAGKIKLNDFPPKKIGNKSVVSYTRWQLAWASTSILCWCSWHIPLYTLLIGNAEVKVKEKSDFGSKIQSKTKHHLKRRKKP